MKKTIATVLSIFVLVLGITPMTSMAHADSSGAIKSRMAKRLGQTVSLKARGVIGENNLGYLSKRGSLTASQSALVNAENADRKAVYQMIAAKTNTSIVSVGKTRAASIRKTAAKGTWVQLASGAWKKL